MKGWKTMQQSRRSNTWEGRWAAGYSGLDKIHRSAVGNNSSAFFGKDEAAVNNISHNTSHDRMDDQTHTYGLKIFEFSISAMRRGGLVSPLTDLACLSASSRCSWSSCNLTTSIWSRACDYQGPTLLVRMQKQEFKQHREAQSPQKVPSAEGSGLNSYPNTAE